jgi:DNA gyrase subunit A
MPEEKDDKKIETKEDEIINDQTDDSDDIVADDSDDVKNDSDDDSAAAGDTDETDDTTSESDDESDNDQPKKTSSNLSELNPEELAREEAIFNFGQDKGEEEKTVYGMIKMRDLELEMQESYLDYAMSVIVARALPDVRDGLKPVHRRVMYSMHELGLTAKAKYRKSALVVGDVLGKYHPHGDIAVYDTLVRMAQSFSMRYTLVDGQGNFGSIDGDSAAAMRYTECRMSGLTEEMLVDIEKNTVDFVPNYDSTREEPRVLPAKLPNLLLNGSMGIAVGMATNIPPHNLGELVDGVAYLIDHPDCNVEDLMEFVKGPDFPTGAEIYGLPQIKSAYSTGRGSIVMRAVSSIEELKRGGFRIVVSALPYQVNKAELISKIADLVKDKKLEGISGLRDESDRNEGVRIVIDLKANAYPKKILNRLYELTLMQTSFHVNMLALIDGIQPRILTLKNVLDEYLKHRQIVVRRRTEFELQKAKDRAHILEGLRIALAHIDEVVAVIKSSKTRDEAKASLCAKFELSQIQANAILDMRLSALAALEVQKIEDEYQALLTLIKELEEILASETRILGIIKAELTDIKKRFADPRRTQIFEQEIGKFRAEDLIPSEQVIVMLTKGNYVKRMPVSAYHSQIRGGKGVLGMETKEEDVIDHMLAANTHDDLLFFTDKGRIFQTKVYDLPSASRLSKGQAIVNILQISPEEKVTAVIALDSQDKEKLKYFVMVTQRGVMKKSEIALYKNVRKTGIVAIKLNTDDKLKWVKTTAGTDKIFIASAKGQSILFSEDDARPMGRSAAGVRGIHLRGEDKVIGVDIVSPTLEEKSFVLAVLENGFGKRTPLGQFKIQLRGGMGIRVASVTSRTGTVVATHVVYGAEADVILASKQGQIIRMDLGTVKILGRDTQGVTLMKMHPQDKVASVTVVPKSTDELVQNVDDKPVVTIPTQEDRPVQEVEEIDEDSNDKEIEKEVEEIKEHVLDQELAPKISEPETEENEDGKSTPTKSKTKKPSDKAEEKSDKKTEKPSLTKKDNEESKTSKIEAKKDEKKAVASAKPETDVSVPEWANVHKDTWREPAVSKLDENIHVHNYQDKEEKMAEKKEDTKIADEKKDEKPVIKPQAPTLGGDDTNWWGGGDKK